MPKNSTWFTRPPGGWVEGLPIGWWFVNFCSVDPPKGQPRTQAPPPNPFPFFGGGAWVRGYKRTLTSQMIEQHTVDLLLFMLSAQ